MRAQTPFCLEESGELRIYVSRLQDWGLWTFGIVFSVAAIGGLWKAVHSTTLDFGWWLAIAISLILVGGLYGAVHFARLFVQPLYYQINRLDKKIRLQSQTINLPDILSHVTVIKHRGLRGGAVTYNVALFGKNGFTVELGRTAGPFARVQQVADAVSKYLRIPFA